MEISRKSWHYKVYDSFWENDARDLCTYFRRLTITCSIILLLSSCAVALFYFIGRAQFDKFGLPLEFYNNFVICFLFGMIYIVSLCFSLLFVVFAALNILDNPKYLMPFYRKSPKKTKVKKEPSLFKVWKDSKLGKYCERIEFKD